jgi:hypothetical protein
MTCLDKVRLTAGILGIVLIPSSIWFGRHSGNFAWGFVPLIICLGGLWALLAAFALDIAAQVLRMAAALDARPEALRILVFDLSSIAIIAGLVGVVWALRVS